MSVNGYQTREKLNADPHTAATLSFLPGNKAGLDTCGPQPRIKLAYTGTLIEYVGFASPGSATSAAVWQIRKLSYSGSNLTDVAWADNVQTYTKIWDNRASYTYT